MIKIMMSSLLILGFLGFGAVHAQGQRKALLRGARKIEAGTATVQLAGSTNKKSVNVSSAGKGSLAPTGGVNSVLTSPDEIPVQTVSVVRAKPEITPELRAKVLALRRARLEAQKKTFISLVALGVDMRAERDQQQSTTPRSWPSLTLGVGLKPWMGLLEYSSFTERSGNNALNVQRKVETVLLWGQWSAEENWSLQPYMALGFGGYRTSAELTLYSNKGGSQGRWIEHGAAALGIRFSRLSPIFLAAEGRVHMNRELDPNPTLSGMLKVGFVLE